MVLRKIENKSFIRSSEGAIASYSYEDIVDGSGIIVFYLSQTRTATATAYSLNNRINSSSSNNLSETSINFDTPAFNLPRILFGTGKIVLHYFTGGASNSTCSVVIKKLSVANTETDLVTVSPFISASSKVAGTATASFTLSSTPLKKGEKIRITITASFYGNAGYIKIDPKNEPWNYTYGGTSGTYTQADSNIEIPFKVDI